MPNQLTFAVEVSLTVTQAAALLSKAGNETSDLHASLSSAISMIVEEQRAENARLLSCNERMIVRSLFESPICHPAVKINFPDGGV